MSATRAIHGVGLAAAGTTKSLESSGIAAAKWTAILTGAGTAAVGAAGLIGVGLVGAIGGVGIAAAAQAPKVKKAFSDMSEEVKKSTVAMSGPIQNVLVGLAHDFGETFKQLGPEIRSLFQAVAPLVDVLGHGLMDAFANVVKPMGQLLDFAAPLVKVFAEELGPTINALMSSLGAILAPASGASEAFRGFFKILQEILPFVGELIGIFVQLGAAVIPALLPVIQKLTSILIIGLGDALPDISRALTTLLPALGTLFGALAQAVLSLSPILPPLAKAFADIFTAIAPLIPQIVSHLTPIIVALIPPLGQLIQALIPIVPPLLKILDAFLPLVPLLANVAVTIVKALLPALIPFLNVVAKLAVQFGQALMKAITDSIPSLVSLAQSFGQILTAVTPLLPPLVNLLIAFTPILPLFTKLASIITKLLVPAIQGVSLIAAIAFHGMAVVFKAMVDGILSGVIAFLGAMGRIPVIGGPFKRARDAVRGFKTDFDSDMEATIRASNKAQREIVAQIQKIAPGVSNQKGQVTRAAQEIARALNAGLGAIGRKVDINVQARLQSILGKMSQPQLRAAGGRIPGYGGGDIVPALLEPGETVVPKHLTAEIAGWAAAKRLPGFAAGGRVGNPWIYNAQGHPPSVDSMASTIASQAAANMGALLGGALPGGGLGGAIGVQRWAGTFLTALMMAGQSPGWLGLGLRRMAQESGGNPFAINLWDSNAQRGDPSRGLMQTIGSTFNAYANGLRGRGIYDPLANIFAAIRYTLARYGTLAAWGRPGGYKSGLDYVPYDNFPALLHRGEKVLPASRAGGNTYIIQAGAVISDRKLAEIVRDADHLVRRSNGGR